MKKYFLIIFSIFFLFSCEIDVSKKDVSESDSWKINIVSSIIPISSIINFVWWQEVEVKTIIPSWVSPHNFDLKSENLIDIENSDLIVSVWLEHIDWFLDKIIENKNNLKIAENIDLIESWLHDHEDENQEIEKHDKHEDEHDKDPHIWLWISNSKIIAEKIKNKLSEIKSEKKEIFQKNYEDFVKEIDILTWDFLSKNKEKKIWNFIVFHDAYNYLFLDLNISDDNKLVFKSNILSDQDLKEMKILYDKIDEKNIKIFFKEPQFSEKTLEKFVWGFDLKILNLDPLWKDETKNWYLENLKINLENLTYIYE